MSPITLRVEYSSTGRSECRHCHCGIEKGALFLGVKAYEDYAKPSRASYHLRCFRAAMPSYWIRDRLEKMCAEDIPGYSELKQRDQHDVQRVLQIKARSSDGAAPGAPDRKRARPSAAPSDGPFQAPRGPAQSAASSSAPARVPPRRHASSSSAPVGVSPRRPAEPASSSTVPIGVPPRRQPASSSSAPIGVPPRRQPASNSSAPIGVPPRRQAEAASAWSSSAPIGSAYRSQPAFVQPRASAWNHRSEGPEFAPPPRLSGPRLSGPRVSASSPNRRASSAPARSSASSSKGHVESEPPELEPRRRRGIKLERYCRDYLHRRFGEACKFGSRCKFRHIDYCRDYAHGTCQNERCNFLHVDVCPVFASKTGKCTYRPCKYLHVQSVPRVVNPRVTLIPRQGPRVVSPRKQEEDEDDAKPLHLLVDGAPRVFDAVVPFEAETSQLTLGVAEKFGYRDFGDSEVDRDSEGEHSDDQSSGDEEPPVRPAAVLKRPAAASVPMRSTTEDVGNYNPPAPVLKRPAGARAPRQSARPEDKDTDVVHKWLVTCKRCGQPIMKVYNHRIVSKGQFLYRALRGFWLPNRDGVLFGRGDAGTRPNKTCQLRLPGTYDVSRARDRKKERRLLKGRLLRYQWRFHAAGECSASTPDIPFWSKCRLRREVEGELSSSSEEE